MQEIIKINSKDNVAVALKGIEKGREIQVGEQLVQVVEDIPAGHKFTLQDIGAEDIIVKYGYPIGFAKEPIKKGSWVHTQNLRTTLGDILDYSYQPNYTELASSEKSYFNGYRRTNGKVGIRNEIWIVPTVGCVNAIAKNIAKEANAMLLDNVEGVVAFPHPYGCSQMGDDQENTRIILSNLINHPNAGAVLVLGLGCENSNIAELKPYLGEIDENRVKFLQCQDVEDENETAMAYIEQLMEYANAFTREPISSEELIIGMKCGGSDGLSGITANPLVGAFSDILISKGGSTVLTEVPEMFGAETILMNRCRTEELFHKTVDMINDFKNYFTAHNQTIYENPSPGNKKGGISSLEDKSLGCTQKAGNAPVADVLTYGETIKTKGLNLLSAPGNDLVAATALAASGAHIVLFTTGRGTPFACPVPTVKISSNTALAEKKNNWIDFNAGSIVEESNLENVSNDLFQYVLNIASGEKVKSEVGGFTDMAIFKQGVTL